MVLMLHLNVKTNLVSTIINGYFHRAGYSYDLSARSRGTFILVTVWLLMTIVLANGYAGTLFSYLFVTKLEPIINSLDELANSNDVQLIIQDRSEFANRILVIKYQLVITNFRPILDSFLIGNYYRILQVPQRSYLLTRCAPILAIYFPITTKQRKC